MARQHSFESFLSNFWKLRSQYTSFPTITPFEASIHQRFDRNLEQFHFSQSQCSLKAPFVAMSIQRVDCVRIILQRGAYPKKAVLISSHHVSLH